MIQKKKGHVPSGQKARCIKKKKRKTKKKVKRVYKTSSDKPWFLYILECGDLSLYTGIALDVEARLKMHSMGKGAKYTSTHLPLTLKYVEECENRKTAMLRELAVKKYSRTKKLALVKQGLKIPKNKKDEYNDN